jgi:MFS family permease
MFITACTLLGLGLSALLGAPIRYIMLNEAPAGDRAAAQAVITIFNSIGLLTSGALVGAVAASVGGGLIGYSEAFEVMGMVAIVMAVLTFALKNRTAELATVAKNENLTVPGPAH